jgi:catechol 2,3-dioxygenase-like lactoylglutathione lyase family enzyme
MKPLLVSAISALLVLSSTSNVSAQLIAAKDGPVVYGHHHLNASNIEAQKKFFVDTLGGTAIKFGANNADVVKFPNVLIFFRQQAPTGGTIGTTVNHIGFSVPNLRQTVDKIKANGFKMITRTEVAPTQEVKDDIAVLAGRNLAIAYVKVFAAKPGMGGGGAFPNASLPGVALNFSPSPDPVVGTQGRALDHIGFEVKNLEEFCRKLEADGIKLAVAYRKVPALNLAIAFITDPWGSYIELTEGLDKVN